MIHIMIDQPLLALSAARPTGTGTLELRSNPLEHVRRRPEPGRVRERLILSASSSTVISLCIRRHAVAAVHLEAERTIRNAISNPPPHKQTTFTDHANGTPRHAVVRGHIRPMAKERFPHPHPPSDLQSEVESEVVLNKNYNAARPGLHKHLEAATVRSCSGNHRGFSMWTMIIG